MGWTFSHRSKGISDRDWFAHQWGNDFASRIKAAATKNGAFYVALETTDERLVPDENGKVVVAIVCLIKWVPRDYYNFGYKDMDEFMGPVESSCPAKILDLLSPFKPLALDAALAKKAVAEAEGKTAYDPLLSAYEWRERCRARIQVEQAMRPGAVFRFSSPLRFTDGVTAETITLSARQGRKLVWRRPDGMRVQLTRHAIDGLQLVNGATA